MFLFIGEEFDLKCCHPSYSKQPRKQITTVVWLVISLNGNRLFKSEYTSRIGYSAL